MNQCKCGKLITNDTTCCKSCEKLMKFCADCKKQIGKTAVRCPPCAMKLVAKQRRKKEWVGQVSRGQKLEDAKRKLVEAKHLYALVTGRQRSSYWYNQITDLEVEIVTLGEHHARSE